MDSTGIGFQGTGSWQTIRFHKHARRRDHRKLSILVETAPAREKFVYEWRVDKSRVGDVTAARKILPDLPDDTAVVSLDGAYDARDIYQAVEDAGARPVIKNRANANLKSLGLSARPRAIRWRSKHPDAWQALYNRRPITESVNYAVKRRFGDRLWARGIWNQRREMGFRLLVYNAALKCRWLTRTRILKGEL